MYVYLPTRFVENLMAEATKVTSAPIKMSSSGHAREGRLSTKATRSLADTFTTAGSVYFLNNLRDKLDEAIEDLFTESRVVVEELYKATLDSSLSEFAGVEKDPVQITQSRFSSIIKRIVAEADGRKRKRLRAALWEIARGRGRPRGATESRTSKRFSKEQFFMELDQEIRGLSRTSESALTRKQVANALELPNEKALDRFRRQFGDRRRWRDAVTHAIAGK
jgi:hypothetical protein